MNEHLDIKECAFTPLNLLYHSDKGGKNFPHPSIGLERTLARYGVVGVDKNWGKIFPTLKICCYKSAKFF